MTAVTPPVETRVIPTPEGSASNRKWRIGLGFRLYFLLGGAVVLMVMATLLAYFSFDETLRHEHQLAESSIPNLLSAVNIARKSAIVVNGAGQLLAATNQADHAQVSAAMVQERSALEQAILEVESRGGFDQSTDQIRKHLEALTQKVAMLEHSSARRLEIAATLETLKTELDTTNRHVGRMLEQALDDQAFYLITGFRTLDAQADPLTVRASESEMTAYRNLLNVHQAINLASLLLDEVLVSADRQLLTPLEDRFHRAMQNWQQAYGKLPPSLQSPMLAAGLTQLAALGQGRTGIIALRREAFSQMETEQETMTHVRIESESLVSEVNQLVNQIHAQANQSSQASRTAASTGIVLLILLNLIGTGGAFVWGSLFVRRYLVRRLVGLAKAMRQMAKGDLDVPVRVEGTASTPPAPELPLYHRDHLLYLIWNDEVTDMARALEVFRRYAHEVQRLNLVEQMAEELNAKNVSLEQAMNDLKEAQEQVIAEQKLASLGQLTAGVAHEIKNPLNFVGNFANVSIEFADEIEELMKQEENLPLAEIRSILDELRTSLGKIKEHGKRADNIVRSMLEHSRSKEGEWRPTNLNALVKQYVELSYHSLRAENEAFNAQITRALDPNLPEVTVVPQDISRVFLNLATNAFHALAEKQQTAPPTYEPELTIGSQQRGSSIEVWIRDNGTGIPDAVRDKIFEPFVTTKPPGEGTGLGLSLTTDILRRHGGSITLDTEVGQYTEMRVCIPLTPPADVQNALQPSDPESA